MSELHIRILVGIAISLLFGLLARKIREDVLQLLIAKSGLIPQHVATPEDIPRLKAE